MARERKAEDPAQVRARQARRMQKLRDGGFECEARKAMFAVGREVLAERVGRFFTMAAALRDGQGKLLADHDAGTGQILKRNLTSAFKFAEHLAAEMNEILGPNLERDAARQARWRPLRDAFRETVWAYQRYRDHNLPIDVKLIRRTLAALLVIDWDITPESMSDLRRLAGLPDAPPPVPTVSTVPKAKAAKANVAATPEPLPPILAWLEP